MSSIESRLSKAEKTVGDARAAQVDHRPVWLLACSELRRIGDILRKHYQTDLEGLEASTATADEIELAKLIWAKADIHCDRAALNQRILELEARVNVYSPIKTTYTVPPLTEAERQSLDRFWTALPTMPLGINGPRSRGMPQEDEDWRNFERLSRLVPVGEL